jgi:hypothetical protein
VTGVPTTPDTRFLDTTARSLNAWLGKHKRLYLIICSALCLLTFSGYAHAKAPWIDEVLQLTIARLGGLRVIWKTMQTTGIQVDPPLLHYVQHLLIRTFGESMFLLRLPAILGFCLMCVALTCLAWRYAPPLFAAGVFFFPYATVLRSRAMDARPYGLMFGFSALVLLCWDRMDDAGPRRRAWQAGFVLSLAAMLSTHFYSILLLLPLAMGEATYWWLKRRIRWITVIGVALALVPYAIWLPILIQASRRFMRGYFYRAAFSNLYDFYSFAIASLPLAGILIAVLAVMLLRRSSASPDAGRESLSPSLRALLAACAGFLLVPVAGYTAGALITGFFVPYYHMIAAFGVVLGVPLLLAVLCGWDSAVGLALFAAIAGHGLFVTARGLSGMVRREAHYPALAEVRKLIPDSHPDIVVPSPQNFLPFQEATRDDPENNLIYLYDAPKALAAVGTDTADLLYEQMRGLTQARVASFEAYLASHDRFYLAVMGDVKGIQEWQFHHLERQPNARLTWMGKAGDFDIFRVEMQRAADPGRS